MDRILFAFPDSLKASTWNENTDTNREFSKWSEIVDRITKASKDRFETENTLVQFSDEAYQTIMSWQNGNATEINSANDDGNHSKAQMLSKLEIYCLRLSLLLSILENPENPSIDKTSVKGTIKLINYYRECGQKVREKAGVSSKPDKKQVIEYLASLGASQNEISKAAKVSQPYVNKTLNG